MHVAAGRRQGQLQDNPPNIGLQARLRPSVRLQATYHWVGFQGGEWGVDNAMPLGNKDYYKILQVDPSADPEVLEAAYKRLARKYHPDMNKSPDATLRMQELNAAYGILRNPVKRTQYDRERASQPSRPDSKYEEERRKREEADAAQRRADEIVGMGTEAGHALGAALRDQRGRARRRGHGAEAAQHRAKAEQQRREQAEARRRAEDEQRQREEVEKLQRRVPMEGYRLSMDQIEAARRKRKEAKAAQRLAEEERRKREAAEVARRQREEVEALQRRAAMGGYRLSLDQAAQAISVTRGTLRDYIKSGRLRANPDGTVEAVELLRAGFIIRNLPRRDEGK